MTGILHPDNGIIEIRNQKFTRRHNLKKIDVAIIPQYANLDPLLTVEENMIFFGLLQKVKCHEIRKRTEHYLNVFEIAHLRKQITYRCSGGEYQRLLVARAFLRPNDIIFMDEPTAGIDILFKNKLWDIFKNEKSHGTTIYLNTHDLNEAEILSDHIGFLFNGKIITIDTPKRLKTLEKGVKIVVKCHDPIQDSGLYNNYDYYIDNNNFILKVQTIDSDLIKVLEKVSISNHITDIEVTRPSLNDIFRKLGVKYGSNTMA
jgi:ABC-2 type transport system ATP-binding protein